MSALLVSGPPGFAPVPPVLRFGREGTQGAGGERGVHWLLKRNCSIAPRQLLAFYFSLSALSLAIAAGFWLQGAPYVLPFAGAELLAVAAALLVYARHAADREHLVLAGDSLSVECTLGARIARVAFVPARVHVEPHHGERSLIEVSGEGKRIAIGRFVRPELRRALADELRAALARRAPAGALPETAIRQPATESES